MNLLFKDFKITESFVQVNYRDMSKIFDKVGHLKYEYSKRYPSAKNEIYNQGIRVFGIQEEILESRINTDSLWFHLIQPKNFDNVNQIVAPHIDILKELGITESSRVAIRSSYYYETNNESIIQRFRERIENNSGLVVNNLQLQGLFDQVSAVLTLSLLIDQESKDNYAFKFDVDTFVISSAFKNYSIKKGFKELNDFNKNSLPNILSSLL